MSSDDGLQDSIERSRQAFRSAPEAPPLIPRQDNAPPLSTGPASVPSGLHPFFRGLLEALPAPGAAWPQAQRDQWLETARNIFALLYAESDVRTANHPPASVQYDQLNRRVS